MQSVAELPQLRLLSLAGNSLVGDIALGGSGAQFSQLQILNISDNSLDSLPSLVNAPNLTGLRARRCDMAAVPDECVRSSTLRAVDVRRNRIRSMLWARPGVLPSLRLLDVSSNALGRGCWQQLEALTQLSALAANRCSLALPEGMAPIVQWALPLLARVHLDRNALSGVDFLGGCSALTHLSARHNALTALPALPAAQSTATHMDVACNPIAQLGPTVLLLWPALQSLVLDGTALESCRELLCEDGASRFPALRHLSMRGTAATKRLYPVPPVLPAVELAKSDPLQCAEQFPLSGGGAATHDASDSFNLTGVSTTSDRHNLTPVPPTDGLIAWPMPPTVATLPRGGQPQVHEEPWWDAAAAVGGPCVDWAGYCTLIRAVFAQQGSPEVGAVETALQRCAVYRAGLIACLPSLCVLDGIPVSSAERDSASALLHSHGITGANWVQVWQHWQTHGSSDAGAPSAPPSICGLSEVSFRGSDAPPRTAQAASPTASDATRATPPRRRSNPPSVSGNKVPSFASPTAASRRRAAAVAADAKARLLSTAAHEMGGDGRTAFSDSRVGGPPPSHRSIGGGGGMQAPVDISMASVAGPTWRQELQREQVAPRSGRMTELTASRHGYSEHSSVGASLSHSDAEEDEGGRGGPPTGAGARSSRAQFAADSAAATLAAASQRLQAIVPAGVPSFSDKAGCSGKRLAQTAVQATAVTRKDKGGVAFFVSMDEDGEQPLSSEPVAEEDVPSNSTVGPVDGDADRTPPRAAPRNPATAPLSGPGVTSTSATPALDGPTGHHHASTPVARALESELGASGGEPPLTPSPPPAGVPSPMRTVGFRQDKSAHMSPPSGDQSPPMAGHASALAASAVRGVSPPVAAPVQLVPSPHRRVVVDDSDHTGHDTTILGTDLPQGGAGGARYEVRSKYHTTPGSDLRPTEPTAREEEHTRHQMAASPSKSPASRRASPRKTQVRQRTALGSPPRRTKGGSEVETASKEHTPMQAEAPPVPSSQTALGARKSPSKRASSRGRAAMGTSLPRRSPRRTARKGAGGAPKLDPPSPVQAVEELTAAVSCNQVPAVQPPTAVQDRSHNPSQPQATPGTPSGPAAVVHMMYSPGRGQPETEVATISIGGGAATQAHVGLAGVFDEGSRYRGVAGASRTSAVARATRPVPKFDSSGTMGDTVMNATARSRLLVDEHFRGGLASPSRSVRLAALLQRADAALAGNGHSHMTSAADESLGADVAAMATRQTAQSHPSVHTPALSSISDVDSDTAPPQPTTQTDQALAAVTDAASALRTMAQSFAQEHSSRSETKASGSAEPAALAPLVAAQPTFGVRRDMFATVRPLRFSGSSTPAAPPRTPQDAPAPSSSSEDSMVQPQADEAPRHVNVAHSHAAASVTGASVFERASRLAAETRPPSPPQRLPVSQWSPPAVRANYQVAQTREPLASVRSPVEAAGRADSFGALQSLQPVSSFVPHPAHTRLQADIDRLNHYSAQLTSEGAQPGRAPLRPADPPQALPQLDAATASAVTGAHNHAYSAAAKQEASTQSSDVFHVASAAVIEGRPSNVSPALDSDNESAASTDDGSSSDEDDMASRFDSPKHPFASGATSPLSWGVGVPASGATSVLLGGEGGRAHPPHAARATQHIPTSWPLFPGHIAMEAATAATGGGSAMMGPSDSLRQVVAEVSHVSSGSVWPSRAQPEQALTSSSSDTDSVSSHAPLAPSMASHASKQHAQRMQGEWASLRNARAQQAEAILRSLQTQDAQQQLHKQVVAAAAQREAATAAQPLAPDVHIPLAPSPEGAIPASSRVSSRRSSILSSSADDVAIFAAPMSQRQPDSQPVHVHVHMASADGQTQSTPTTDSSEVQVAGQMAQEALLLARSLAEEQLNSSLQLDRLQTEGGLHSAQGTPHRTIINMGHQDYVADHNTQVDQDGGHTTVVNVASGAAPPSPPSVKRTVLTFDEGTQVTPEKMQEQRLARAIAALPGSRGLLGGDATSCKPANSPPAPGTIQAALASAAAVRHTMTQATSAIERGVPYIRALPGHSVPPASRRAGPSLVGATGDDVPDVQYDADALAAAAVSTVTSHTVRSVDSSTSLARVGPAYVVKMVTQGTSPPRSRASSYGGGPVRPAGGSTKQHPMLRGTPPAHPPSLHSTAEQAASQAARHEVSWAGNSFTIAGGLDSHDGGGKEESKNASAASSVRSTGGGSYKWWLHADGGDGSPPSPPLHAMESSLARDGFNMADGQHMYSMMGTTPETDEEEWLTLQEGASGRASSFPDSDLPHGVQAVAVVSPAAQGPNDTPQGSPSSQISAVGSQVQGVLDDLRSRIRTVVAHAVRNSSRIPHEGNHGGDGSRSGAQSGSVSPNRPPRSGNPSAQSSAPSTPGRNRGVRASGTGGGNVDMKRFSGIPPLGAAEVQEAQRAASTGRQPPPHADRSGVQGASLEDTMASLTARVAGLKASGMFSPPRSRRNSADSYGDESGPFKGDPVLAEGGTMGVTVRRGERTPTRGAVRAADFLQPHGAALMVEGQAPASQPTAWGLSDAGQAEAHAAPGEDSVSDNSYISSQPSPHQGHGESLQFHYAGEGGHPQGQQGQQGGSPSGSSVASALVHAVSAATQAAVRRLSGMQPHGEVSDAQHMHTHHTTQAAPLEVHPAAQAFNAPVGSVVEGITQAAHQVSTLSHDGTRETALPAARRGGKKRTGALQAVSPPGRRRGRGPAVQGGNGPARGGAMAGTATWRQRLKVAAEEAAARAEAGRAVAARAGAFSRQQKRRGGSLWGAAPLDTDPGSGGGVYTTLGNRVASSTVAQSMRAHNSQTASTARFAGALRGYAPLPSAAPKPVKGGSGRTIGRTKPAQARHSGLQHSKTRSSLKVSSSTKAARAKRSVRAVRAAPLPLERDDDLASHLTEVDMYETHKAGHAVRKAQGTRRSVSDSLTAPGQVSPSTSRHSQRAEQIAVQAAPTQQNATQMYWVQQGDQSGVQGMSSGRLVEVATDSRASPLAAGRPEAGGSVSSQHTAASEDDMRLLDTVSMALQDSRPPAMAARASWNPLTHGLPPRAAPAPRRSALVQNAVATARRVASTGHGSDSSGSDTAAEEDFMDAAEKLLNEAGSIGRLSSDFGEKDSNGSFVHKTHLLGASGSALHGGSTARSAVLGRVMGQLDEMHASSSDVDRILQQVAQDLSQ